MQQRRGITPIFVYSGSNIDALNDAQWRDLQAYGKPLVFGTARWGLFQKRAWEIYAVTQVYGEGIERLYNGDLPKGWRFSSACNKNYVDTLKNTDRGDQYYTYGYRFHEV